MDFSLTGEQRQYQALVRDFARKEVAPHVKDYDREERYPFEIVRKMAALGFVGGTIPEEYGGPGLDHLTMALGIEEMSRVCIHMGSAMGRASGLVGEVPPGRRGGQRHPPGARRRVALGMREDPR